MRWSKSINVARLRLSQRVARFIFSICVVMLFLPGCTTTWISRKPDLRTLWGDINVYNRLSLGFERRHLEPPTIQVINESRWLHGPVPRFSSSSVVRTQSVANWQESKSFSPGNSTMAAEPMVIPAPAMQPNEERLNPPIPDIMPAPASSMPGDMKGRVPVEIELPPLESLREPSGTSGEGDQWRPRKSNLDAPTALHHHAPFLKSNIQPASHQTRKAALPGASILFARP